MLPAVSSTPASNTAVRLWSLMLTSSGVPEVPDCQTQRLLINAVVDRSSVKAGTIGDFSSKPADGPAPVLPVSKTNKTGAARLINHPVLRRLDPPDIQKTNLNAIFVLNRLDTNTTFSRIRIRSPMYHLKNPGHILVITFLPDQKCQQKHCQRDKTLIVIR